MTFSSLSLRNRLLLGYAVVLATVVIGYVVILTGVMALGSSPKRIVDNHHVSIQASERMVLAVQAQQNAILRKLLSADYDLAGYLARADEQFNEWLERAGASISLLEEVETIRVIEQLYAALQALIADRDRWATTYPWETDVVDAFQNVIQACERLAKLNFDAMASVSQRAHERVQDAVLVATAAAFITLLVGLWVSVTVARRLSEPLERIVAGTQRIAQGDYQVQVPESSISELAQLARQFNIMAQALQRFRAMDLERVLYEQRQSEAVLQSIDDGLVIFGHDARIQRLNPIATRQLGLDPEHCIGQRLGDLLTDADIDAEVRRCLGLDAAVRDSSAQELKIDSDGGHRYLRYTVLPIVGDQENRLGAVMVIHDITEYKAFEQMRSELVMRASHELRTPITSIRMGIGMLAEKKPFAEHSREHELFETVKEEIGRLTQLTNDLFDLSRLQAGRIPLEPEPLDPAALLESARQRFALKAAEQEIELSVDITATLPKLLIDQPHFERVLDNLLNNALRHTPAGGFIQLRARRNDHHVKIEVTDTGVGIDFAQQRRVFEPFVQASDSGGAGLGLAICREIVHQHGGSISLSSRPGQGTTFYIVLPA